MSQHQDILLLGPTGIGKTWLACALAQKACRDGFSALHKRTSELCREPAVAHTDGSLGRLSSPTSATSIQIEILPADPARCIFRPPVGTVAYPRSKHCRAESKIFTLALLWVALSACASARAETGSAACAACHSNIYKSYMRTPMAVSSGRVGAGGFQEKFDQKRILSRSLRSSLPRLSRRKQQPVRFRFRRRRGPCSRAPGGSNISSDREL